MQHESFVSSVFDLIEAEHQNHPVSDGFEPKFTSINFSACENGFLVSVRAFWNTGYKIKVVFEEKAGVDAHNEANIFIQDLLENNLKTLKSYRKETKYV